MDRADVTGPGTAITTRPSAFAAVAVRRAPLRTPGLDHHGARRECRNQAVADQEAVPRRPDARCVFADHCPVRGDSIQQPLMASRVSPIQPAGLHRDGITGSRQRAAVSGSVDTERSAGHHYAAALSKAITELGGHMLPIAGRCSGPYHRYGLRPEFVQAASSHPQRHWGSPALVGLRGWCGEAVESLGGPLDVLGNHQPAADRGDGG